MNEYYAVVRAELQRLYLTNNLDNKKNNFSSSFLYT